MLFIGFFKTLKLTLSDHFGGQSLLC